MAYQSMPHYTTDPHSHNTAPLSPATHESRLLSLLSTMFEPIHTLTSPTSARSPTHRSLTHQQHHFTPRFDLEERVHTYEIIGDLPGAQKSDLVLATLDDHTLEISGFVSRYPGAEKGVEGKSLLGEGEVSLAKGGAANEDGEAFVKVAHHDALDGAAVNGNGASPAVVEDEEMDGGVLCKTHGSHPEEDVGLFPPGQTHPNAATATSSHPEVATEEMIAVKHQAFKTKHIMSERQTGEFLRRFHFSNPIVEESVIARFECGVLRISLLKGPERGKKEVDVSWMGAMVF